MTRLWGRKEGWRGGEEKGKVERVGTKGRWWRVEPVARQETVKGSLLPIPCKGGTTELT